MKVLLTAFEPFGNHTKNASWEAVKLVENTLKEGSEIEKLLLPVEYDRAADIAIEKLEASSPDVVLSVGLAASRKCLSLEYLAINVKDAEMPDNAGKRVTSERIIDEGESVLYTNFPYSHAIAAMLSTGVPCEASFSAGTYVCNDLYYRLLYHIRYAESKTLCGFLHIPPEGTLDSCRVARAIEALLSELEGGK